MGDQLRLSTNGPRELDSDDYRADDQPKVIRNPESIQVRGQAKFEPLVDLNDHKQLLAELDRRAGSQKGKVRSKDRSRNPLGGRIFDMDCGWLMYRTPYNGSFRYKCGLYDQSHGQRCNHNTIDGPAAATFVLSCIRQRLLQPQVWDKLERRLRELASTESDDRNCPEEIKMLNQRRLEVDADLETAKKNLALARTSEQFNAISSVFDDLQREKEQLEKTIQKMERKSCRNGNVDAEIEKALENARQLCHYASCDTADLEIARQIIEVTNVRLFTRFRRTKQGKRTLNKLAGGVVTFGAAEPPVQLYDGPTDRKQVKNSDRKKRAGKNGQRQPALPKTVVSRGEGKSLGNVSRGDRI